MPTKFVVSRNSQRSVSGAVGWYVSPFASIISMGWNPSCCFVVRSVSRSSRICCLGLGHFCSCAHSTVHCCWSAVKAPALLLWSWQTRYATITNIPSSYLPRIVAQVYCPIGPCPVLLTLPMLLQVIDGPKGCSLYCLNLKCRAPLGRLLQPDLTCWWRDVWTNSYVDSTRVGLFRCIHRVHVMFST